MRSRRPPILPRPDRIRRIEGSFAWIDHRFLRKGHLHRLTLEDLGLYLFLTLAADRNGVSYYRREKMCDALGLSFSQFEGAKTRLIERGLIAFRPHREDDVNGFYQVLPLPAARDA